MAATGEDNQAHHQQHPPGYEFDGRTGTTAAAAAAAAEDDWDDSRKAFVSRIPPAFDESSVRRVLEEKLGPGSVRAVSLLYRRDEEGDEGGNGGGGNDETEEGTTTGAAASAISEDAPHRKGERNDPDDKERAHRGFAFVTFDTEERRDEALRAGTVRGGAKATSKRKHTLYVRPLARDGGEGEGDEGDGGSGGTGLGSSRKDACHLWPLHRCPYGDKCRFVHEGAGGCLDSGPGNPEKKEEKKRQKCFAFRKRGKCKLGDSCPFSHESKKKDHAAVSSKERGGEEGEEGDSKIKDKSGAAGVKDCLNWKTKGKCRKLAGGKCPYRHDDKVREAALARREKNRKRNAESGASDGEEEGKGKKNKIRQPLSVRVFGLNYDTTEKDVREYFAHCGPIVEITFPRYEDSGRSKGYCGILFQSPKAVDKAVEMNETELHGRWLSVQPGKMFLRQWEERERRRGHGGGGEGGKVGDAAVVASTGEDRLVGEFGQKVKKRKRHGYKE